MTAIGNTVGPLGVYSVEELQIDVDVIFLQLEHSSIDPSRTCVQANV
jgi:hypothetical protein